ncbi:PTS system mannose/fructose/N-acetylgalactosamine-specific transporter subunit IID, partial [Lacticaseibacillus paracasei subsp. paracasei Lpp71]
MPQIIHEPAVHLEVEQLSVTIKRKKILDHLSLSLVSPNIYGIVGPNGTGKSVLLKTLLGFIRPSAGSVKMNGVRVDPRHDLPVSVGAIIEHPGFIGDLNGHDNLMALGNIRSQLSD